MLLVLALVALCGVLAALAPAGIARVTAGLLLVLVLPGYALSAFVFGRGRLAVGELLLCTLGASLVVSALAGLALDVLPGHMGRSAWAILLSAVTVISLLGAVARPPTWQARPVSGEGVPGEGVPDEGEGGEGKGGEGEGGEGGGGEAHAATPGPRVRRSRTLLQLCLGALALAVTVAAVAVAHRAADRSPGFSELSVLPLSSARDPRMSIRVRSHEHHAVSLRLTLSEDGRRLGTVYRTLLPGEEWHLLSRGVRSGTRRIVVRLYRSRGAPPFLHTVYYLPGSRRRVSAASRKPRSRRPRR